MGDETEGRLSRLEADTHNIQATTSRLEQKIDRNALHVDEKFDQLFLLQRDIVRLEEQKAEQSSALDRAFQDIHTTMQNISTLQNSVQTAQKQEEIARETLEKAVNKRFNTMDGMVKAYTRVGAFLVIAFGGLVTWSANHIWDTYQQLQDAQKDLQTLKKEAKSKGWKLP